MPDRPWQVDRPRATRWETSPWRAGGRPTRDPEGGSPALPPNPARTPADEGPKGIDQLPPPTAPRMPATRRLPTGLY